MRQKSFRKKARAHLAVLCLGIAPQVLLPPGRAFAAASFWLPVPSQLHPGSWFSDANWIGGIPKVGEGAVIGNGSIAQINASASTNTLVLESYVATSSTVELQPGGSLSVPGGITLGTTIGGPRGRLLFNGSTNLIGPISMNGSGSSLEAYVTGTVSNAITIGQNVEAYFDASAGAALILAGPMAGGRATIREYGTTIFAGTNATTGDTGIIAGATLQIGNGGTTGSLGSGKVNNEGTLRFNRSDAVTVSNAVIGAGALVKAGAGILTLSGQNAYSGATSVTSGTLNVTGSIAPSAVTVQSGATLSGTGTVGSTTVAGSGTLAPGNSIGTLTVNGNLTLAAGSIYSVEVSPTAADRIVASGTASLNGNVAASVGSGAYNFGQRFTILTAMGGVSGSFGSLTGVPAYLKGQLSYDAGNAYLTLSPNSLAPLVSNTTANQGKLVAAIDAAVTLGAAPGTGFQALYALSGPAMNSALDQISGQVGANTVNAVGQASLSFLNMTAQGGSGGGNFAPGSAFHDADAPHRAQLGAGATRVWGSAYGGHVGLSADAASGAASLSSNNFGFIGGLDLAWDKGLLTGVTVGLGRQNFSSGNGTGSSDDIMIGVYARKDFGPLYVTAAFGYGSHHIETLRVITVSGTDVLQGQQNADDYGGRLEAGWRMALDDQYRLSPYFAVAAESFETPAYAERALSGASTFALSVAARSSSLGRTELGSGLSRDYETENGVLTADLRLAWAHQLDDLPLTQASFQSLPGASFLVTGVRPASDTALLGAGFRVQNRSGLFFGFKGESQLGAGTTILEGMGHLGWRW